MINPHEIRLKDKKMVSVTVPIKLSDVSKDGIQGIQIFKAGVFNHLWYGEINFTPAIFLAMVQNFKDNVLQIDCPIDYDHEMGEAAAWIKDLYLSQDQTELWANVKWTPPGKVAIDDQLYRYLSGDFVWNFVDNEKSLEYGPVLWGAALTNRPFLKGMAPTTELNDINGGMNMNLVELQAENSRLSEKIRVLGVSADASQAEVKSLKEAIDASGVKLKALETENVTLKANVATSAKEAQFAVLLSQGKAVPAQKESFMAGDMIKFAELAGQTNQQTTGSGKAAEGGEGGGAVDKDTQIMTLAEKKFAAGGFNSMGDAISAARKEVK